MASRTSMSPQGKSYSVKNLEHYTCPNCNEKVYPPEAMRQIQAASPAYSVPSSRRPERPRRAPTARPPG